MAGRRPYDPDGLDTAQAAAILRVSTSTVRRWADVGRIPHYRTPGGRRRYQEADVRAYARALGIIREQEGAR